LATPLASQFAERTRPQIAADRRNRVLRCSVARRFARQSQSAHTAR